MSRKAGMALLLTAVVVALGIAAVASVVASYSWSQVADYRSPFLDDELAPAVAGPPHTQRLVLVIVDGLRGDASRRMTALETLRQHGNDLTLVAGQPSLSYPGWTTILSGAPQRISGVTTNGIHERVRVETLLDTARSAGVRTVAVGPWTLDTLYGAKSADGHFFGEYEKRYMSTQLVRRTLELVGAKQPAFVLVHLPDVDEAGHEYGGASKEYLDTAMKVDTDLSVLVNALQDGHTTFAIVSDHGHIDSGGHGGWEPEAVDAPAVLAGPGVGLGRGTAKLEDLAPTVAALAGIPVPRDAIGRVLPAVLASTSPEGTYAAKQARAASAARYVSVVTGARVEPRQMAALSDEELDARMEAAAEDRASLERADRTPLAGLVVVCALLVLLAIAGLSWRALVAALAGTVAYYAVYLGLFFGVHGLAWSLSGINSEDRMNAYFLTRLGEAALAGLVAVLVAAIVYPLLRREPRGAWGRFLLPWLSLGPATVLAVQATLALQAAWYVRQWGVAVTWAMPDLRWGFKFDLDLMQAVALGVVAVVAPVVTLLVGRYHPRVTRPGEEAPDASAAEQAPLRAAEE